MTLAICAPFMLSLIHILQDLTTGMWQYIILDFETGETVFAMDVSNRFGYNNMAIGMYAGNSGNALYCPTGYMELLRLQDSFVYLPEMPYREVDLDKAARNILSQEQFELDGGEGTVASWSNSVSIRNVHPNTTVAFRMNNLSGSASDLSLYAYGTDGKLAKVASELWSITDETGEAVTELTDGTLYEVRITCLLYTSDPCLECSDWICCRGIAWICRDISYGTGSCSGTDRSRSCGFGFCNTEQCI